MQSDSLATRKPRHCGIVHVKNHTGHRAGYQALFAEHLGLECSTGRMGLLRFLRLVSAQYVLLGTIDGQYVASLLLGVSRALLGRPTTGLFLRPQTAFRDGLKYWFKKMVFSAVKHLKSFRIFTIVPFNLRPEYEQIANGWVHDPEIWDLVMRNDKGLPQTPFANDLRAKANGRPIVAFIGGASKAKGFAILCDMLAAEPDFAEDVLVVVAGRVSEPLREAAFKIKKAGAIVTDRFMTDVEILSLYATADCVWCVYDASYDQASGVFGRAFQTGCPVIVREGAMIASQADALGMKSFRVAPGKVFPTLSQLAQQAKREQTGRSPSLRLNEALTFSERTLRLLGNPLKAERWNKNEG